MTPTPTPRTDERANSWESIGGQWVNAEFARWLERELAAKDAHADEIYKASVDLAAKLEADLATERALADRLAIAIEQVLPAFGAGGDLSKAWDTWNKARN
jgi:uncharacterized protein with beta-barrel porin domain